MSDDVVRPEPGPSVASRLLVAVPFKNEEPPEVRDAEGIKVVGVSHCVIQVDVKVVEFNTSVLTIVVLVGRFDVTNVFVESDPLTVSDDTVLARVLVTVSVTVTDRVLIAPASDACVVRNVLTLVLPVETSVVSSVALVILVELRLGKGGDALVETVKPPPLVEADAVNPVDVRVELRRDVAGAESDGTGKAPEDVVSTEVEVSPEVVLTGAEGEMELDVGPLVAAIAEV